jgi:sugar phosphate isomerase/epimerase
MVWAMLAAGKAWAKPKSVFGGVEIGIIISPTNFTDMPLGADEILKNLVEVGISGIEIQDVKVETYAGAPGDKYIDLRKKYHDAGVHMYAFRLATLSNATTDAELNYFFNTAEALGAHQITVEPPTDTALTQRVGDFAAKRKIWMGYHNHTQVNFNSWNTALAQSKYNGINFNVGHFTAAASQSRIPFIRKYHERITCLHLKDRKYKSNGG